MSLSKAEMLEDFMADNDFTDDVLIDVLLIHMRSEYEETGDSSAYEDLRETLRDEFASL